MWERGSMATLRLVAYSIPKTPQKLIIIFPLSPEVKRMVLFRYINAFLEDDAFIYSSYLWLNFYLKLSEESE